MISSVAFVNAATVKGCGQTCAHTDHLSERLSENSGNTPN